MPLLTAFYSVSLALCSCRIIQYTLLVVIYFWKRTQNTETFIYLDLISSIAMVMVGCVMVLFNISLTHGVMLTSGHRQAAPSQKCMLFPTLAIVTIVPLVFLAIQQAREWTYYCVAGFDLCVAAGLFLSLVQMLNEMQFVDDFRDFDGKNMAKYFVRTFGVSFLLAAGINFAKSFWLPAYFEVVQEQPYIFAVFCLSTNLF